MYAQRVVIDFNPESIERYRSGYGVIAIDVIRATTTLTTGTSLGRRCFAAASVEEAFARAATLEQPLLAGERGGDMPEGFHMNNSPCEIARRTDTERALVLVSSAGTRLIRNARACEAAYLACFRNFETAARYAAGRHRKIAVIGAGTRGEFREEDQICCAWVADLLMNRGYEPQDLQTADMVARWRNAPPEACRISKSAAYLERSGQLHDLDFILAHVNDLDMAFTLDDDEIVVAEDFGGALEDTIINQAFPGLSFGSPAESSA